ncbi:Rv1535 domain-containing protein [Mycobacterium bohemicum]|uniref:Rv1535 domain-containing protein n=1 Tax=Mycobacterium bohemicum TaxID=56425 RepID=UPI0020169C66|nr:Rv1535 domain-containing protein [Mycobacterium bohemicum]
MSRIDLAPDPAADPLVSSIASVLRVPLLELYALLWRVGVVDIRQSNRARRRCATGQRVVVAACPTCPNFAKHRSAPQSRRSPRLLSPEPVSTQGALAVCSQATG